MDKCWKIAVENPSRIMYQSRAAADYGGSSLDANSNLNCSAQLSEPPQPREGRSYSIGGNEN